MDPATAFGLVASIITIIQVGIKTASEVKDVYQSETGAQKRNNVLEQTANKLDSTCGQLRSCLSSTQDGQRLSPAESELRDIALKCTGSAKKLNDLLEKLKAKPRKRDALFKTIKAKWKQNEVDELQREVDEYQKALNTRMLTDLRLELSETQLQKQKSAFSEAKVLRDALWFPQMHHRHQQITEAYPGTFHWIFRHAKEAEKAWDCFVCWLQNGEGLYWINGKAGSGKSTLMNYTSYDPKTRGYLKAWSGDTPLIIAKVFFWNSGSALEKSQQGLLRTLLYQVLKESPELASTLFPSCQSAQMASLRDADFRDSYWTEKELISALEQLVSVSSISQRFCFFIDGLDEFDGDYELLVSLLQRLCSAQHIKICVASRPVPAFKDAFADSPSLELQDLTAVDMREYVSKRLERNPRGKKLAIDEASSYSSLVEDILRKASGVFLWVRLVVDRLLKDLDNRDTIEFLKARLDELPGDLTQLFRSMMGSFDPKHQEEAARSFRTVFAAPNPRNSKFAPSLSILDLFFAEEATVASALTHSGGKTDWKQLETRVLDFECRIASTCCGLIEFIHGHGDYEGDWIGQIVPQASKLVHTIPRLLHRSVKEFLEEQDALPAFSSEVTYSDHERLLAARVITMKTILEPGLQKEAINDLADYCLCIAQHMEEQTQQTNTVLLDETNRSCMACARATGHQTWYSPDNRHGKDIITTMTCAGIDGTGKTAEFQQFDLATELDFVSYAIVFELFLYARAKVSEDPSQSQKSDRMPVLHAMHCGAHPGLLERFSKPSWHSLLRTLFDQGADPNFEYKGKTAWRLRLDVQGIEEMSASSFAIIPEEFGLFLDHGANCNQTFDYCGIQVLSHSKVRRSADHSSNNSEQLYSMLQGVITDRMTQLETSETEKATTDSEDLDMIIWACFARVYTQDESKSGKTDANVAEIAGSDQSISARPRWRISLLYWATHCALETADAQEFRHRLEEGGATLQEPFIVKLFTWKYRLDHFEGIVSKVLNREESTQFTRAWRQAFPNYTIPLFPRLINAMLMILHNGRFLRNDGPLRANELLRAGKIISDSFERRKAPNVDMVLRTAERLQDVGFLSSEGLLWATQILRTGRLFWDNGLISADSLFTTQPLLTAGVSSSTEAVLRGAEIIRDNGWIGDLSLLSSSALASNGQPLFTNEFPQAYDLFCDNELSPHGPSKACTFM